MLLGGLRCCEVLGLPLPDLRPGERRVLVGEGKDGRQRIVSVSARFFTTVASEHVFVVLKGPAVQAAVGRRSGRDA